MPPAPHEHVGRLARCTMCGEFFFTRDPMPECDECIRAVCRMRSQIEPRGGSLLIVDGRIVVRTAEQRRDLGERALSEMRGRG